MQALETQTQQGTKLKIETDRSLDQRGQGDSVLRAQTQSPDGSQVYETAYVEFQDPREADLVAKLIRSVRAPQPELQDQIAREVQAVFGSQLSGRDAQTISRIVTQATQQWAAQQMGKSNAEQAGQHFERLAERLERAAGARASGSTGGQQHQQGGGSQGWGGDQPGQGQGRGSSGR